MISYNLSGGCALRIAGGLMTLLLVVMVGGASAVTPINDCTTISSPGEYILTQNIEDVSMRNCIVINSDDVVFDGANFTIDGVTKDFTYGVHVNNELTTLKHVTIKNLKVTDWYYGIFYEKIQYGSITNSIVNLNGNESHSIIKNNSYFFSSGGIFLDNSNDITITDNTINSNNQSGIHLYQSSNNDISKNNIESNNFSGVMLINGSSNNNIENNKISNYAYQGITVSGSSNNILKNNRIENNQYPVIFNNIAGVGLGTYECNGIVMYSNNNTLTNNTINSNSKYGLILSNSSNNEIENNKILNNQYGISLSNSTNNIIEKNRVSNNQYGIRLGSSNNNTIYNNYFNNTNSSILKNSSDNRWNISKISGINIIGGSYLGGNFWANSSGTGYSQTCLDVNGDGICDQSYILDEKNIDYLPLLINLTLDKTPPKGVGELKNISYASSYINWTWTDPGDPNFDKVQIYINNKYKTSVLKGIQYYKAKKLYANRSYSISTRTVDIDGFVSIVWENHTAWTKTDFNPPMNVTKLKNITYENNYINWTWKDPKDIDFKKVMVFIDNKFKKNVSKGRMYYNATNFKSNTRHTISTWTVDMNGNINKTWTNHSTSTAK